jgi:23S rRNA (cytosine1962-C5)-methyltransferase
MPGDYHAGVQPALFEHPRFPDHQLLDSGDGEKLERFGEATLVRPDPQALWPRNQPELWKKADLRFVRESDRGGRWEVGRNVSSELRQREPSWKIGYRQASFWIRPTRFKHVGVFPEQAANWDWVREHRAKLGEAPKLLNLFGYTGVASVLASQAGYSVTHVDASKTSLAWLRENASLSGLPERALRIVLEDAMVYLKRELRRGNRYSGILLDPPHYGRGPKGERWQFEEGIAPMLQVASQLLEEQSFMALSSYAIGTSPLAMANLFGGLKPLQGGQIDAGELALPEGSGAEVRRLPCGFCARWSRGLN